MRKCNTGGAVGADQAWERICNHYGWEVWIFSFLTHALYKNIKGKILTLSERELIPYDEHIYEANKTLKRSYPTRHRYVNNLLRRNWAIVQHVNQVLAVGVLNKERTMVQGGTGWGVQMGINRGVQVFVFDQEIGQWFAWVETLGRFEPGFEGQSPPMADHFAGIGTRQINRAGIRAIREICGRNHNKDYSNA